jgi:small GTP-binding protein
MFEIKIAIAGHVSVGKSTLLNALLGGRYNEVSKGRTTAAVNHFRINQRNGATDNVNVESQSQPEQSDQSDPSVPPEEQVPQTVPSVLEKVTFDNLILRQQDKIEERWYDITVDKDLIPMRDDTDLILVDLPGLNEAGNSTKYKDYLLENWSSYDGIIFLMDVTLGGATDSEKNLLQWIKSTWDLHKSTSIIVVGNKVDGKDPELLDMADQVCKVMEQVFDVTDRVAALKALLDEKTMTDDRAACLPVFIPMSALSACAFRFVQEYNNSSAASAPISFAHLDSVVLDHIAVNHIGKSRWSRMSAEEQEAQTIETLRDPKYYEEAMSDSNFSVFMSVLDKCFGGTEMQANILERQVLLGTRYLDSKASIASQLRPLISKQKAINKPVDMITDAFWTYFTNADETSFRSCSSLFDVECLAVPIKSLYQFMLLAAEMGIKGQETRITASAKTIVLKYLQLIYDKYTATAKRGPGADKLNGLDWDILFSSVLLGAYHPECLAEFGHQVLLFEEIRAGKADTAVKEDECIRCTQKLIGNDRHCANCKCLYQYAAPRDGICPHCDFHHSIRRPLPDNGKCKYCSRVFIPHMATQVGNFNRGSTFVMQGGRLHYTSMSWSNRSFQVQMPHSLRDPRHHGHILWLYGKLMTDMSNLLKVYDEELSY